jgi:type II secretory pathway pseudopilin PulG
MKMRKSSGFTITEILITIAITGMTSILISTFLSDTAIQQKAFLQKVEAANFGRELIRVFNDSDVCSCIVKDMTFANDGTGLVGQFPRPIETNCGKKDWTGAPVIPDTLFVNRTSDTPLAVSVRETPGGGPLMVPGGKTPLPVKSVRLTFDAQPLNTAGSIRDGTIEVTFGGDPGSFAAKLLLRQLQPVRTMQRFFVEPGSNRVLSCGQYYVEPGSDRDTEMAKFQARFPGTAVIAMSGDAPLANPRSGGPPTTAVAVCAPGYVAMGGGWMSLDTPSLPEECKDPIFEPEPTPVDATPSPDPTPTPNPYNLGPRTAQVPVSRPIFGSPSGWEVQMYCTNFRAYAVCYRTDL